MEHDFLSGSTASGSATKSEIEIVMGASWARSYKTIEELVCDSDFIGLVEITKNNRIDTFNSGLDGDDSNLFLTTFSAKVLDPIVADADEIEIVMTGKNDENGLYQLSDDPLMSEGEKWFIFARKNDSGSYTILSGPHGRFSYNEKNDTLTSLFLANSLIPMQNIDSNSIAGISEVKLADIKNEVRLYMLSE